ncbi:MAG: hypothetical protein ACRD0J_12510, partial [Acidimicrobiales bacterium]
MSTSNIVHTRWIERPVTFTDSAAGLSEPFGHPITLTARSSALGSNLEMVLRSFQIYKGKPVNITLVKLCTTSPCVATVAHGSPGGPYYFSAGIYQTIAGRTGYVGLSRTDPLTRWIAYSISLTDSKDNQTIANGTSINLTARASGLGSGDEIGLTRFEYVSGKWTNGAVLKACTTLVCST